MAELSRYEVEQTRDILENDNELRNLLSSSKITLTDEQFTEIAKTLLENRTEINNKTIEELNLSDPPVARDDIEDIIGVDFIKGELYRQFMYTFKYSTIKIFFRKNYYKFMPDYDFTVINSQPKMKLFVEAFMREYDRFASIIDEMYNLVDVDRAPEQYLNYLAQAVGYEREDSKLLTNVSFRELIKNIVEVYKIKGTNFSFELFFNFLGFQATLKEYWFDKRFGDPNITSNPETGTSNPDLFSFYLTTKKPTRNIPEGMKNPYVVPENKLVGTLDVNEFNRMISAGEYTAKQLIGDESGYPGQPYTYFKTNVMEYSLENIRTGEGEGGELSASDLATINRYANFLTPIFLQKNVTVTIKPFEDYAGIIILTDADRTDPRSERELNETMLHHYQGYQPAKYYWDDGVRYYNEDTLRRNKSGLRSDISDPEGGGHFISNFYKDTTSKMSDIKDDLINEFPYKTEQERLTTLNNRISDRSLFSNDFPDRDLMYQYIDTRVFFPFRSMGYKDEYDKNVPLEYNYNFSFKKGDKKRLSEAYNEEVDNKTKIQSIVLDNGSGNSVIKINKVSTHRYIKEGDEFKIFYSKDFKNNGVYTVKSASIGTSEVEIEVDGQVNSGQKTSGGFIQIYFQDWKMVESRFPFMFDRVLDVKQYPNPFWSDEMFHYQDYDLEQPTDDLRFFSEKTYEYEDLYQMDTNRSISSQMSSLLTFDTHKTYLKVAGLYNVTYDSTTYTRSSYKFYNENPDFYRDYLDVAKT